MPKKKAYFFDSIEAFYHSVKLFVGFEALFSEYFLLNLDCVAVFLVQVNNMILCFSVKFSTVIVVTFQNQPI